MNKDVVTLQLLEMFKGKYCNKTLAQYSKNIALKTNSEQFTLYQPNFLTNIQMLKSF